MSEPGQIAFEASCPPMPWAEAPRALRDIWHAVEVAVRADALNAAAMECSRRASQAEHVKEHTWELSIAIAKGIEANAFRDAAAAIRKLGEGK